MKKHILMSVMLLVASLCYVDAYAAEKPVNEVAIVLNGTSIGSNAYINNDTVYLPIRAACEALGYQVGWKLENGSTLIPVTKANDEIILNLTDEKINDNGHSYYAYRNNEVANFLVYEGKAYMESGLFSEVFAVNVDYNTGAKQVILTSIDENNITISTVKKDVEREDVSINLQYPQISGLSNAAIEAKINTVFKDAALDAEKEGLRNAAELNASGYIGGAKVGTDFNYRVKYNQNELLSVITYNYQYAGGAHGMTVENSYTFDLDTGEALKLSNLFNQDTKYTEFINAFIRSEIDKRIATGAVVELAPFKTVGDNPGFYLSNDSIVFYFQQYEYFPYAAGIQEFAIKFSDMKDKFSKKYDFLYEKPIVLHAGTENILSVGNIGRVVLKGNPSTGYEWHYTIADSSIVNLSSQNYIPDSTASGVVGSGGTYYWDFKALQSGQTTITFQYYREWESKSPAGQGNTAVYTVRVN
ncbi:protease inhibitor I42 family protein [Clostridium aminobutyricum]|uniref:Protease inhibitor I42 family protein n=1 Tax=Clostridium aminobutyricum TaxID=33953 RepID=A0A939D675_CLOAM|nr:protease inhibitor I42 family protein [Clostridium aminobutyricum]MBN7771766.1 protease inhibitor I42 family protein [Clostridium aminobutyricum]